jgi:hypothetical protein
MDADDFATDVGKVTWFSIEFWTNGELIQEPFSSQSISVSDNVDYAISSKPLPYTIKAISGHGYRLYYVKLKSMDNTSAISIHQ